jgi:SAM-dependent methyltransferase
MELDPTIEAYEKIATDFHQRNAESMYHEEFEVLRDLIELESPSVLDIGCGTARDAEGLINQGFRYTGIDASPTMLAIAQERFPDAVFFQQDIFNLDIPPASFDAFWAAAVVLHVPKEQIVDVLSSFHRVLKDYGVGFISVKEKQGLDEGFIEEAKAGGIRRYFSFFEAGEMEAFLDASDFSVIETREVMDPDGSTKWLCYFVQKD